MSHPVVAIGAANVDIHGFSEEGLRMQDSNPGRIELCLGGVSRNISENLVRMGVETTLLTAVGDDVFGRLIRSECQKMGIDLSRSLQVSNTTSSTYLAIMDDQGEMALALSDMSILDKLTVEHLEKQINLLEKAPVIVLDAGLTPEVMAWLVSTFPEKKIILDPVSIGKCRRMNAFTGDFYCIKMNRLEAGFLSGKPMKTEKDLSAAADSLMGQGVKKLYITLGKEGVFYKGPGEEGKINAPALVPLNATGAGDAFTAAVVYGELQGWTMKDTASFAVGASSVALMSRHTVSESMSVEKVQEWTNLLMKKGEER